MRSALIVGAGGQDGRLLARLLSERGYTVHGWKRGEVDLLRAESVARAFESLQLAEVYYLAAFHHASEDRLQISEEELLQCSREVHVDGLRNALSAIKTHGSQTRLFYAASSHVFGPNTAERQSEATPFAPISAYGISKAEGIECCRLYRKEGVFAATGILFNHESSLRKASFLSQKIVRGVLQAQRDPAFKLILGDLEARADWGFAPDYVEAMVRILQSPAPDDFVVASGELHSVREFAEAAFAAGGLDWSRHVETDSRLLKRTSQPLCGDAGKLRTATGWSPTVSFLEMVRRLVEAAGTSPRFIPPAAAPANELVSC